MSANLYTSTAALYDTGNRRVLSTVDLDFYMSIIPPDASVLEVGCGTGRVAIALAERGNLVTGVDLSLTMLDVFQRKLTKRPSCAARISLYQMDMRNLDLGQSFDWIIFPFRVFQALTSDEDRMACLSSMCRHMTETSSAILTLFNPKKTILDSWGKKGILDFEEIDEVTGRLIRRYQDQMWHHADNQIIATRLRYEVYESGVLVEELHDDLELGYLYPEQCTSLFAQSHMIVADAFGYYDRRELSDAEKMEQIYILKRENSNQISRESGNSHAAEDCYRI